MKKEKRIYIAALMAGLIIILICDVLLIVSYRRNYYDKLDIIGSMVYYDEYEDGVINHASDILKGESEGADTDGVDILREYGYPGREGNVFYGEFLNNVLKVVIISVFLYAAYVSAILLLKRHAEKHEKNELETIEKIISEFRNGKYDYVFDESFSEKEGTAERIYMQLESLGSCLKALKEEARREREETKVLVTDISHQLKTPVAALRTSFEILTSMDLSTEERAEFSERCRSQLRGLENLLNALINISRMEHGMIEIKRENSRIFDTVVHAVDRVYVKAEEKHINISLEGADSLKELMLPHDRKWTGEALINILENAVKYSDCDTHITIRLIKLVTFLRIEIEDEGIGIPAEEYNNIFKRFYRGSVERVRKEEGSGVGLYLAREIISRHGGTITVSKGQKGGSVFTVQLPLKD